MKLSLLSSALALLSPLALAARDCSVTIAQRSSQGVGNPDGTNWATYSHGIRFLYPDGHDTIFQREYAGGFGGECFSSELPYQVCIVANFNYKDGYMDYADQHADFHSDYCNGTHAASPFAAGDETQCYFDCLREW